MAGSVNKAILVGHLGADPESRNLQNGDKVVTFRIATSESWRDRNTGDRKEKTEWHSIVVWNENLAKVADQYLKKGMKVYVEGQLQTRKWQDQGGNDRYTTEVVLQKFRGELQMLDSRNGDGDGDRGGGRRDDRRDDRGNGDRRDSRRDDDRGRGQGGGSSYRDLDDEIPFAPEWR